MTNNPNNPDHGAAGPAQVVRSGDAVATVPDGIGGYAKAIAAGLVSVAGTISGALLDGRIDGGELGTIVTVTVAAVAAVYAVGNKQRVK